MWLVESMLHAYSVRVASTMGKLAVGAVLRASLSNEIVAYGV